MVKRIIDKINQRIWKLRKEADICLKRGDKIKYAYICNEIKGLSYSKKIVKDHR